MTIILIVVAIIISKLLGGLFVMKYRDKLHLILGFSAGTVLGVALFDLLPESIDLINGVYNLVTVMALVAVGFSAYLLIDRVWSLHQHDDCEKPVHKSKLSAVALLLHSFLDGFIIGLAFQISDMIGWIVAAAVLVHSFSDGINITGIVAKDTNKNATVKNWLIAGAVAPVVGIITANYVTVSQPVLGLVIAFFAGLFLYISASDLIPESHHEHPAIWTTIATIAGIALVLLLSNFVK